MKHSIKLAIALAAVTTMATSLQSASLAEGLPSGPGTTAIVHVGYLEDDGTYVGAELLFTSTEAARIGADALDSGDTSSVAGTDSVLIQAIQAGEAHIAVDPGSSGSGCGYGTATPLVCPYVTWTANGRSVPHVSFYDQSSSDWPASAIVANWGSSSVIDTSWSASSCGAYSGAHCVDMHSANYGNTGWVGRTSYSYDSGFHFIDGSVHVYLNDYYVYGTLPHKQAVCHEVGHALGLGHDSSASSCLYFQILTTSTPIAPVTADFSQLALIY